MSYRVINLEETGRYENAPATAPYRVSTVNTFFPLQSARIVPDVQFIDRMDELRNIEGALPSFVETFQPAGSMTYRAYLNSFIVLLALAGFDWTLTTGAGTIGTTGPNATTVTGVNALNSAVITVASNAGFPNSGTLNIAGALVTYTGRSADGLSFTGCGNHAATTGGESVKDVLPVGTFMWTFTKRVGASVGGLARTAQIRDVYTPHNVWLQGQGYSIANLTLDANGNVSTDWNGLVFARLTADPALSPSFDVGTIPPVRRGDLYVSWLANTGVNDDFNIGIANPLAPRRTLSLPTSSKFPDLMQMGDEPVAVTGSIPKAALAAADLDALIAGTTFAAKAIWNTQVGIAATAYPYTLVFDMPACQYTGGQQDELAQRRRFGFQPDYKAMWSESAGYDVKIYVVNSVAAISTPF